MHYVHILDLADVVIDAKDVLWSSKVAHSAMCRHSSEQFYWQQQHSALVHIFMIQYLCNPQTIIFKLQSRLLTIIHMKPVFCYFVLQACNELPWDFLSLLIGEKCHDPKYLSVVSNFVSCMSHHESTILENTVMSPVCKIYRRGGTGTWMSGEPVIHSFPLSIVIGWSDTICKKPYSTNCIHTVGKYVNYANCSIHNGKYYSYIPNSNSTYIEQVTE